MNRSAALAAIGSAALTGCDVRRVVAHATGHGGSCLDVAEPSAGGIRVERGVFLSAYVADAVRYAIAIPQTARRLSAVAYLLPGRGGTADGVIDGIIGGFLAEHLRRGGAPFTIAAIDSGESYFHRRATGEDRLAVVTDELGHVARDVLAAKAPLREAIMGQSMGGYGALLAAEMHSGRYRAVAVAGPAIFPSYDDERRSVGDAFDSAADYAAHDVIAHAAALRHVPVHISIGKNDPFLPGVRQFARALPSAEIDVRDGCHDDGFWRASAPTIIEFVARALA